MGAQTQEGGTAACSSLRALAQHGHDGLAEVGRNVALVDDDLETEGVVLALGPFVAARVPVDAQAVAAGKLRVPGFPPALGAERELGVEDRPDGGADSEIRLGEAGDRLAVIRVRDRDVELQVPDQVAADRLVGYSLHDEPCHRGISFPGFPL